MSRIKKNLFFIPILAVALGAVVFVSKKNYFPASVPSPLAYDQISKPEAPSQDIYSTGSTSESIEEKEIVDKNLPDEINLKIPFVSQAPYANWADPYKEFCEEASSLMAASYIKNESIRDAGDADNKLLAIKDFEDRRFGYYKDTNVAETIIILREHFKIEKVELVLDPTIIDIKKALTEGRAVVVPLAGREIGNPFYTQPGPIYHMLVIKGYTKDGKFITNDPGTRRGADYVYDQDVLMNAIGDWDGEGADKGQKVMIVAG